MTHTSTNRRDRFRNTRLPGIIRAIQQVDRRQVHGGIASGLKVIDVDLSDDVSVSINLEKPKLDHSGNNCPTSNAAPQISSNWICDPGMKVSRTL